MDISISELWNSLPLGRLYQWIGNNNNSLSMGESNTIQCTGTYNSIALTHHYVLIRLIKGLTHQCPYLVVKDPHVAMVIP